MKNALLSLLLICSLPLIGYAGEGVRLKDLGRIDGWRDNQLIGQGVVTGLAGTGDSQRSRATLQSVSNLLSQFGLNITADQVASRNVAVVMVTARLPAYANTGDKLDVMVSSMGDARSLVGGALLVAPLKGPDGKVYALAQGPLSVGGYKYDQSGNVVQKNHPTVGSIPNGGTVEVPVTSMLSTNGRVVTFVLKDPDITTSSRVAQAINLMGDPGAFADAVDASRVDIEVPLEQRGRLTKFLARIEGLAVDPDQPARVVVNERTGSVISGGDVRLGNVTVTHGDLRVAVTADNSVSQPILVSGVLPGVRTETVQRTRIDVSEPQALTVQLKANNSVADLVYALMKIKTSPRDMISILQGIKAAGALRADLLIQ